MQVAIWSLAEQINGEGLPIGGHYALTRNLLSNRCRWFAQRPHLAQRETAQKRSARHDFIEFSFSFLLIANNDREIAGAGLHQSVRAATAR